MYERGIPCIVTDSEHFDLYLPCELIILTERYLYKDVSYIAEILDNCKIVFIDESKKMTKAVYEAAIEYFGDFKKLRVSRATYEDGVVRFCGRIPPFTKTEMRILMLFLYSPKKYYKPENIARFCLNSDKKTSAVSHINSMNKKTKYLSSVNIIISKYGEGYKLNELI